jgi:endonuclease/exonuclease/phosphatase family metal-dependent hydrolase
MKIKISYLIISSVLLFYSCKPISQDFNDVEGAVTYTSKNITNNPNPTDTIKVMSWNIRFGIARFNWFGDACGKNTIFSKDLVEPNLNIIADSINLINPDILLVQEIDINSKRTSYINQIEYLLNKTKFNYAYYAPMWQSQFIPSHGLGKMDMGQAIFSKWPLQNLERIQLPLRGDQDAAEKYFYLHYCVLKGELSLPGFKTVNLLNVHSVAFATDDTKKKHYDKITAILDNLNNNGSTFICGGDFNTLPPNASKTDYCVEDICENESFHQPGNEPLHKEGSNYKDEDVWVTNLFNKYNPSLPIATYLLNEPKHFTHSTKHPNGPVDRRLDYFFTNHVWAQNTEYTHLGAQFLSDHAPISVSFILPK